MARIDHSNCTHPRTPAGRAACRRAGGVSPTESTPRRVGLVAVEPRARKRRAPLVDAKPRAIRGIGDMPDVPHVFGAIIHRAWTQGWEVRTEVPYNDDEKRISVTSTAGVAQLVWRSGQPHGVHAVWFRPHDTSISSRLEDSPVVAAAVDRLLGTGHE